MDTTASFTTLSPFAYTTPPPLNKLASSAPHKPPPSTATQPTNPHHHASTRLRQLLASVGIAIGRTVSCDRVTGHEMVRWDTLDFEDTGPGRLCTG
ncbi:hypothetical protein Cob_v001995 [Colletotrichum orbiculare MAFF 240422]|uniref:Uncharacterized protein n=1 Tax=Colletotrichum orbiculare (strain 104-T / ATCC 96160 / CBS 514.97 / LARS 414 / MAFF 240422) TaxID=1213857 RepID=A0A484G5W9_COLOR|nr:hypothetical protein Cob_v001995 [Colletotrichum orbiculare MAFF 240422]